jgi:hypothetical protein
VTVLKKYVRNQCRLKGCMVQVWVTEEVIEFVVDYMDPQAIGKPVSYYEGRCLRKGRSVTLLSVLIMTHRPKHIS